MWLSVCDLQCWWNSLESTLHIEVMVTLDTVIGIHRRSVDYYFLVAVIVVHVNVLWVTKSLKYLNVLNKLKFWKFKRDRKSLYIYTYLLLFNIIIFFFKGWIGLFDIIHKLDKHTDVGN